MLDRTIKNIYDRLYRKGLRVKRSEIAKVVSLYDSEGNITDNQKAEIVNKFLSETGVDVGVADSDAQFQELISEPEIETLEPPIAYEVSSSNPSYQTIEEIVNDKVDSWKVNLSEEQVTYLINEIHSSKVNEKQAVEIIEDTLNQVIAQSEFNYKEEINSFTGRLSDRVEKSFQVRNTILINTFGIIKGDLEVANSRYKSSFKKYPIGC